ncbi:putative ankyrin repeat protein [Phytophthora citrophthora]|uniref:Ankyrin repeat protein n=1 Tax=Phytophthora citrophthora TaxID=4793 RepID=A0AAD9LMN5_9STRA|nr:putative ankyrin repeat protein [Phytophthora citrophthora]
MAVPFLRAVSSALCDQFQGLPHVIDLVNSFLTPSTIDSAVYNDLQRVIQVYRHCRPYTVGAMDGAAGLGKLELVQWLYTNRTEGCSHTAFINAAANHHLNVLEWLYEFYPPVANPVQEIVKAAECGNVEIVEFLTPKVGREIVEEALEAAAACGHVAILENLLGQRPYGVRKAVIAGALNGQTQVVQFFLENGYNDRYRHINPALMNAAQGGHCEVVRLLIDRSDEFTVIDSLIEAAGNGQQEVVRLLLEKKELNRVDIAHAMERAASTDQCQVLKLLLNELTTGEFGNWEKMQTATSIVDRSFLSAVDKGQLNVVKLLIGIFSRPIIYALTSAAHSVDVLDFFLDYCERHDLKDDHYDDSITVVVQEAASCKNIKVVNLLLAKCKGLQTGSALATAVMNNDVEMLKALIVASTSWSIQEALVHAVLTKREKLLEILLDHSSADTIERALIQAESSETSPITKLLLARCDVDAYGRIFDQAANGGLVGIVQLLLNKMSRRSIRCAMISAAIAGHTKVVEVLKDLSDSTGITCAFEMAVVRGHVGIVELLRSQCDPDSIEFAMTTGDAEVVRLVRNKRPRLE